MDIVWRVTGENYTAPSVRPVKERNQPVRPVRVGDEVMLYVEGAATLGNDISVRVTKITGDDYEGLITRPSRLSAQGEKTLEVGKGVEFQKQNIFHVTGK